MSSSQLITIVSIAVAISAIAAAFGFSGRSVILGIDLGTSNSAIAYFQGKQLYFLNSTENLDSTPSYIAFDDHGRFIFGEMAKNVSKYFPERAVFATKRIIGRSISDPFTKLENQRYSCRIVAHPTVKHPRACAVNSNVGSVPSLVLHIPSKDSLDFIQHHKCIERGSIYQSAEFKKDYASEIETSMESCPSENLHTLLQKTGDHVLILTPTASACLLLDYLKTCLVKTIRGAPIQSIISAMPADFDICQRISTEEAFKRAGLKPSRILSEPAAAAISYKLHKKAITYVLVFDIGGGTTDVSILYLKDGAFTVIGSSGDGHLGGEDFDDCIYNSFLRQLREVAFIDSSHSWLKNEAERVKIALSNLDIRSVPASQNEVAWESDPSKHFKGTYSRERFQNDCKHLFDRLVLPIQSALVESSLSASQVDEVLLIGGSSRLLGLKNLLASLFNRTIHSDRVNPDLAVAQGAALVND
jgi:molecular chaperone DnaK (HSP70)